MTITPGIAGSSPFAGATGTASAGSSQLDKDTFLKLLVAQLKYQDPSKPVDSSEFLAQSAQFTMVEKLTELAAGMKESASVQRSAAGTAYLGKSITAVRDNGQEFTGVVTSVDLRPDGVVLHVGDTEVPLAAVTEVALPPAPASVPTTTPTTSNQEV